MCRLILPSLRKQAGALRGYSVARGAELVSSRFDKRPCLKTYSGGVRLKKASNIAPWFYTHTRCTCDTYARMHIYIQVYATNIHKPHIHPIQHPPISTPFRTLNVTKNVIWAVCQVENVWCQMIAGVREKPWKLSHSKTSQMNCHGGVLVIQAQSPAVDTMFRVLQEKNAALP